MITAKRSQNPPDKLVAVIQSGRHQTLSGVSEKLGGHDEGPDPHDLLEASLAACTIITVQMYAERHQWKLDSTEVMVKVISESKEKTEIQRNIKFIGNLDPEQKNRLMEIANKCPIHNLLQSQITINTVNDNGQ